MFCPACRAEYRAGFTRCSDCDVDLVQELSESDTRVRKAKREWTTTPSTIKSMYREGHKTVHWWALYKRQTGHLALVFNRHPRHQLGCDPVWGRFPHLVDCRAPFVGVAVPRHFFVDWFTVRRCRELGKEKSETKSSAK
jgi:hypothetical protein